MPRAGTCRLQKCRRYRRAVSERAAKRTTWVAPDERRATNTLYLNDSELQLPILD
jgi:hypothetical protein